MPGQPEGRLHAALRRARHRRRLDPVGLTWTRATPPSKPSCADRRGSSRASSRPATVADLDDATRAKRLAAAVRDAGWLELRDDGGDGAPLAGGVEAAIVADALGGAVADVAFAGPCSRAISSGARAWHDIDGGGRRVRAGPRRRGRRGGRRHDGRRSTPSTAATTTTAAYVAGPRRLRLPPRAGAHRRCDRNDGHRSHPRGARRSRPAHRSTPVAGQSRLLTPDDLAAVVGARPRADERRPRRCDARRARRHRCVRGRTAPVRRARRVVPGGAAPARRGALPDGRFAQRRAATRRGRSTTAPPVEARRGRSRRQGVLRPRRAHGVRDRGAGARRHREHVGVHRARVPAARVALVPMVRRRRRAARRAAKHARLGVADGLS